MCLTECVDLLNKTPCYLINFLYFLDDSKPERLGLEVVSWGLRGIYDLILECVLNNYYKPGIHPTQHQ